MHHLTQNLSYNDSVERAEAAKYLGVSISTLDRFASKGRLTKGRAKRKTRPVTVFIEEELAKLKAELEEARPQEVFRRLNTTDRLPEGVGFRLDPYYIERLLAGGTERGVSAGEYARTLVIRALEDDREEGFKRELASLRNTLAEMFYVVLVTKLGASEADAREVVSGLLDGGARGA